MGKWTSDPAEIKKISKFSQQLSGLSIVKVTLDDGTAIEGVRRTLTVGNNGGAGGGWAYYGNFDIETHSRRLLNIDLCDVTTINDLWSSKSKEYEEAGLVEIVDCP